MLRCSVCQGTINELNLGLGKKEMALAELAKEVQKLLCEKRMKDGSSCTCGQHKEPSRDPSPAAVPIGDRAPDVLSPGRRLPPIDHSHAAVPKVPPKEIPKELTYGESTEATKGLKAFVGLNDDKILSKLLAQGVQAMQDEFIQHGSLQDLENFYYVCYGIAQLECDMPAHVKDDIKKVNLK